jgi:hypothetical protein
MSASAADPTLRRQALPWPERPAAQQQEREAQTTVAETRLLIRALSGAD